MANKSPLLLTDEEIATAMVVSAAPSGLARYTAIKQLCNAQHDKILAELKAAVKGCKYSKKQIWEAEWNNRVLDLIARMEDKDYGK